MGQNLILNMTTTDTPWFFFAYNGLSKVDDF